MADMNANKVNGTDCANEQPKKKRMTTLLVVAGAIIVLWFIWYWYANLRGFVATDNAYIDANYVSLSSTLMERITKLTADEGGLVQAG